MKIKDKKNRGSLNRPINLKGHVNGFLEKPSNIFQLQLQLTAYVRPPLRLKIFFFQRNKKKVRKIKENDPE